MQRNYDKQRRYRERNKEKVSANKKRYRGTDKYKQIQRIATIRYGEKIKTELTDKYIVGLLRQGTNLNLSELYANKELIALKREKIILDRLINKKQQL